MNENKSTEAMDPTTDKAAATLLQDIRQLLRYHQMIGIENYPLLPAIDAFLHSKLQPGKTIIKEAGTRLPTNPILAELHKEMAACRRCRLCESRTNMLFGSGPEQCELVIVTGWPSEDDDRLSQVLSGQAGELFDKMLAAINLSRQDVFIIQVVKCLTPGNRLPKADEINTCLPFLLRQIEILQPRLICTLGPLAAVALLKREESLFRLRGRIHAYHTMQGAVIPLLPTIHPAFLLKNPDLKKASWQDLQLLQKKLAKQ
jgi:uracil-DNA glycosylase family 4